MTKPFEQRLAELDSETRGLFLHKLQHCPVEDAFNVLLFAGCPVEMAEVLACKQRFLTEPGSSLPPRAPVNSASGASIERPESSDQQPVSSSAQPVSDPSTLNSQPSLVRHSFSDGGTTPMHDQSKIAAFMALRANGWSLAKISKELNVSKATLWSWDNKRQSEIHLLKHFQLERLQEKFLPSYEEELSQLRSYLERIESALQKQDFTKMTPEFLLQMSLQVRTRLAKMREQVPLRTIRPNTPLDDIPLTGCVSRQNAQDFRAEFSFGEHSPDDDQADSPPQVAPEPLAPVSGSATVPVAGVGVSPAPSANASNGHSNGLHLNGNGKPHLNGNGHCRQSDIRVDPCSPVLPKLQSEGGSVVQNRTFPNVIAGGPETRPLKANDLQT